MGQNKYVKLLKSDGPHHKNSEFVGSWYRIIGGNRDEWHLCNGAGNTLYARRDHCSEVQNDEDFWADPTELEEENTKRVEKHYELWEDFEAFDVMVATLSHVEFIGFLKGNILKYQLRLGKKEGESIEKDLQKIETYKQILKESL